MTRTVAVTRSGSTSTKVTVRVSTANGTAVAPADYTAVPLVTLAFAAGQSTKLFTVWVAGDTRDENDETFTLRLSSPVGATIADGTGIVKIYDNDAMPSLTLATPAVAEGSSGLANRSVSLKLSAPSGRTTSVAWALIGGTAVLGDDVEPATGTVTFPAGTTTRSLTVSVDGDTTDEPDERFYVHLGSPKYVTLPTAYPRVTVVDDDAPMTPELFPFTHSTGTSHDVLLQGVGQAGTAVLVYAQPLCAGPGVAFVAAEALASGIALTAPDNATTQWSVRAGNTAHESSGCSNAVGYTHDDLAPAAPSGLAFSSGSPADDNTPHLTGTVDSGASARLYLDACLSSPVDTASTSGFATTGFFLAVPDDSTSDFWLDSVDEAGNRSTCVPISYVEDSTAPAAVTGLALPNGASGVGTAPVVTGTAEAGAVVDVYALDGPAGACTGPLLATVPAADLAVGGRAPFTARATSYRGFVVRDAAGNALPCSGAQSLGYTETSTETEPNDDIPSADPGASGLGSAHQYGELHDAADADLYAVTVPAGAALALETTGVPGDAACLSEDRPLDTELSLYTSAGALLASDADGGAGGCSALHRSALAAGTYYVKVTTGPQSTAYPLSYDLSFVVATPTTTAETEPNGTAGVADNLGAFTTLSPLDVTGGLGFPGDVDWFKFTLAGTTTVSFETLDGATSVCAAGTQDSYLTVYAGDAATILGANDDGGEGACSALTLEALPAGTYYVQLDASEFDASATFDYRLALR